MRGVFREGRVGEMEALRAMGARESSLGRSYEGHLNGALIVALYGTASQRQRACDDVDCGHLFGVWSTQDDDPVRIERATRSVGAHGLLKPLPFARLFRDPQMYLRQPAPDAVLARVRARAFSPVVR